MQEWAEDEMKDLRLGDKRLEKRTICTMEYLAKRPESSVPQACGTPSAIKGTYRLWSNRKVKPEGIIGAHCARTARRIEGKAVVLVIQDTTNLYFTGEEEREGTGYLDPKGYGLKMHTSLCASEEGVPQGILCQKVWARSEEERGKKKRREKRPLKAKESYRWIEAFEAAQEIISEDVLQVTIADREADFYDLFAAPRRRNDQLIRGTHNRRIEEEEEFLYEALKRTPEQGSCTIEIGRRRGQPPRRATLTVRYGSFELKKPEKNKEENTPERVRIQAILVTEEGASKTEAIQWLLLTTLPIEGVEDAFRYIRWYSYRWLVERYHFVLKSGCAVEKLQLENAQNLHRAVATYSVIAWRLLWMLYEARLSPQSSCEAALEEDEWKVLHMTLFPGKRLPESPPSLGEAIRWIAQLGGFLGRKGDGEPGVKTLWRGYRVLQEKVDFWKLLKKHKTLSP